MDCREYGTIVEYIKVYVYRCGVVTSPRGKKTNSKEDMRRYDAEMRRERRSQVVYSTARHVYPKSKSKYDLRSLLIPDYIYVCIFFSALLHLPLRKSTDQQHQGTGKRSSPETLQRDHPLVKPISRDAFGCKSSPGICSSPVSICISCNSVAHLITHRPCPVTPSLSCSLFNLYSPLPQIRKRKEKGRNY